MSLAEVLERAAVALPGDADVIRPANGDPMQLMELLDSQSAERVLCWLLTHEPDGAAEVAVSWCGHPKGAEYLGRLDESALPKRGRKILRRARHRLRAGGIELADARNRPERGVRRLPAVEDDLEAAYVSPPGPRGSRPVYLIERNPSGGARLFEVLVDEVLGVIDCEVYTASRSQVRRFIKEIVRRQQLAAVEAAPASVRALIARVSEGQPKDRPVPRSFNEWRSHLTSARGNAATPGEQVRVALGEGDLDAGLKRAVELVRKYELGPWAPSAERLTEIAERHTADAADNFASLAGELYRGDFGLHTGNRFEESAYVLWRSNREEDARASLSASSAFRERAPEENQVAVALCELILAPILSALRARRLVTDAASSNAES